MQLPSPSPSWKADEAFMIASGWLYFVLHLMEGHHSSQKGLVKYYAFPARNAWKLSKELVKIKNLKKKKKAMWEEAFKHRKE